MKTYNISIKNDGYVYCKSCRYSAHDFLSESYTFSEGINMLIGEIDSGNWAISYLLSMYRHRPKDFVLFEQPKVAVNDKMISLKEFSKASCYMDKTDPLFSSTKSVKKQIKQGLAHSKLDYSYDDIKNIFELDSQRVERSLNKVGNEIFRAMAAIGLSYNKEVFCFPWLSHKQFEYYHGNLTILLEILEKLGKIVIIPVGMPATETTESMEQQ